MKKWRTGFVMMNFSVTGSAAMDDELKIDVMWEGNGDVAKNAERGTVHYQGRLSDDTIFDPSRPRGQPFGVTIGAGQVIQEWE